MLESRFSVELARRPRAILIACLVILLTMMVGAPAMAQGDAPEENNPTDEEVVAGLQPVILSEVREGDKVTVTIEIPPSADTFTASGQPNTNFATNSNLRVGFNSTFGFNAVRTFIAFNGISAIPAGSAVTDARFRLYVNGFSPNGDSPLPIQARFLNTAWDPNLITWNNFNPQWGAEIGIGNVPAQVGWVQSANAASTVQQWVSGTRPNFGIMLQGNEGVPRERVFTSLNGASGQFPRLIVTYTTDVTPPTATMNSLPAVSPASFTVRWSGTDNQGGSGIRNYDVQFRINGGGWNNWLTATTLTQNQFTNAANGALYEFRVRATDNAGNVGAWSNPVSTRADTVPPNATMNPLPQFTFTTSFQISWTPNEDPANINWYDVQFQVNGGSWQNLLTQSTLGQTTFNGSQGNTYGFRVRAQDKAGNVQSWSNVAQASTTVSAGNPTASIVPFNPTLTSQTSFNVAWQGTPVQGTTISAYEVQVSRNGGAWQAWNTFPGTTLNSVFNAPGDGTYAFRVRARDNLNRWSEWSALSPLATKAVDAQAPFVRPQTYMPFATS